MTLAAVVIGWVASNLGHVREREAILMRERGPTILVMHTVPQPFVPKLPWMWRVLGAKPVNGLGYDPQGLQPEEIEHLQRLFPEATLWPLEPMPEVFGSRETPQSGRPTPPRLSKRLSEL